MCVLGKLGGRRGVKKERARPRGRAAGEATTERGRRGWASRVWVIAAAGRRKRNRALQLSSLARVCTQSAANERFVVAGHGHGGSG